MPTLVSGAGLPLIVRRRGLEDYTATWRAMQAFTAARASKEENNSGTNTASENGAETDSPAESTTDEIWLVEHPPVFTLGQAGRHEHVLAADDIPLVQSDRGGQVTYHGPGQLVAYLLFDLRRLDIGPRVLVERTEQAIVDTLADVGICAYPRSDAHGVYVRNGEHASKEMARKIASLGLRIRRGCSYHGLALNVDMDLEPFTRINPCGYAGLVMTQVRDETATPVTMDALAERLLVHLRSAFGFREA